MEILAAESTNLFVGSDDEPRQVVRVRVRGSEPRDGRSPATLRIEGPRVRSETGGRPIQSRQPFQEPGLALVKAHLDTARRDGDYKFVLAELDYLKPYWDAYPEDREYVRQLLKDGRLEFMGGTYNEPNTNLT